MSKSIKRVCATKITNAPKAKISKLIDFKNLTKDISILQTFYDFIDDTEYDVIDDYLSNHDFNDFLDYFISHHLYKPDDFCLIFKVCSEILMRIVGDINKKHSLSGQSFAEGFLNSHKPIIYLYLKNNKSNERIMSCLKFLTSVVLQSKDIAIKLATGLNFSKANFNHLLTIRKLKHEEDVHSCALNCFASFFVMGSNYLIRKACEESMLVGNILKDLRFERFHNVQLIIEILHDKIIKNQLFSKTAKVKFFSVTNLRFLLATYEWKGEAASYDEFQNLSNVDVNCNTIHDQLHRMLIDLCSNHHLGIAFVDNLLCQSTLGNLNKKLYYFITSDGMQDFFSHSFKHELLISILTACPDLISSFVEYLVGLMLVRKPEFWSNILKYIVECYRLVSCEKINDILTAAWNYNKGEKFIEIAMILCLPSKSIIELLQTDENIRVYCDENIRLLRSALIDTCEKVITWINISDVFRSQQQKSVFKTNFEEILLENFTKCSWDYELKLLLSEELQDESMFRKLRNNNNNEIESVREEIEEFDLEISEYANNLRKLNTRNFICDLNGIESLTKCYQHFISTPFNKIYLLKLIGETLNIGEISLKKKYKRCLIESLTSNEFISDHWTLMLPQDETYTDSELKRNCIFDVIIACISDSKNLKTTFYERVHPLRLLSVYGATLSASDQKLFYLLTLQSFSGVVCSDYNFILFGSAVTEHYSLDSSKTPVLRRPIMNSQCFNLIEDEKLAVTISHYPISRPPPTNNMILIKSQPNLYDPFFLLEWISQLLNIHFESELQLEYGIDLKQLYSKQVLSFLITCQTSESRHVRLVSKLHLEHLLAILEASENVIDFPMKFQVQMVLYHLLHSLSNHQDSVQLSSIISNYYVKMLKLISSPGKKLFSPIMDIFIMNPKFDLLYVPNFLKLMYSPDIDAKLRQIWCLKLLSESVKCAEDFRIILNTKVLTHVLPIYANSEQSLKKVILYLIKSCVSIPKVAVMLYNFPQFVMWLSFIAYIKKDKINHYLILEIIEQFIGSLKCGENTKKINIEDLESTFKHHIPDLRI